MAIYTFEIPCVLRFEIEEDAIGTPIPGEERPVSEGDVLGIAEAIASAKGALLPPPGA